MLWWGHQSKAETPGQAEKREKRMKQIGKVQVPQEAFLAIVKRDEN